METRQQRLIRQALERGRDSTRPLQDDSDGNRNGAGNRAGWRVPGGTSLRGKSLRRTEPDYLPRTLTAYEWEDYYREHGVPPEHRRNAPSQRKSGADNDELTGHRRSVD